MKNLLSLILLLIAFQSFAQHPTERQLKSILGVMPKPPALHVDTLEKVQLANGWRYKIKFLSEDSNTFFHAPPDFIYAYLFLPEKQNKVYPAIVAIHQDGSHDGLGKAEPAGIAGDSDQYYGLELFNKGYVVICPDRFYHADRRRINNPFTTADAGNEADKAEENWVGQLLLEKRTKPGKEVYDLMRSVDVLCHMKCVDTSRIGAIGHSGGGYELGYFMFMDRRIKAGVSSCGIFELTSWYDEKGPRKNDADNAIPGLLTIGKTADYIGFIAPRPLLMTRGLNEWGWGDSTERWKSAYHVNLTKELEKTARSYYQRNSADSNFKVIYFSENNGKHSFPPGMREQAYAWLDKYLKN